MTRHTRHVVPPTAKVEKESSKVKIPESIEGREEEK